MIASLALMLIFLQQQFDRGDYNKAIDLLSSKSPGAHWSVAEELVLRAGSFKSDCQPRLISSFQGTLEVTCSVGEPTPYRFHVDLVRRQVVPMDAHTRELVETVA